MHLVIKEEIKCNFVGTWNKPSIILKLLPDQTIFSGQFMIEHLTQSKSVVYVAKTSMLK